MTTRRALLNVVLLAPILLAPALPGAVLASEGQKKKTGGDSYFPITTLTGATNQRSGRRGVITVECGLDIPNAALRARAQLALPRLRAAYVQILQVYASGMNPGDAPDADYLSKILQRETDRSLGQPGARLLLGAILVR